MIKDYFDVFAAISFAVHYLKDREERVMRPLIMDALALAGQADDEDEFVVSILFYTLSHSRAAADRIEKLPLDDEVRRAVRVLEFNTDDHIPDPFRHRIERIRDLTQSQDANVRMSGFWALSVYCRYLLLTERLITQDINYYYGKEPTPEIESKLENLRGSLSSVKSVKRMAQHIFGDDFRRHTSKS